MIEKISLPEKERLIVQRLRDFIDDDNLDAYFVALVVGIRKIGKTTALLQLKAHYPDTVYIDFLRENTTEDDLYDVLEGNFKLLLLDEITHLEDFENTAQHIYNMAGKNGFKVIMTGSSSAHLTKLSMSKLGGGRARLFRLPPITFIEYLYFTDRISGYDDYTDVCNSDFADYLLLKNLTPALRIQFDAEYFNTFYSEVKEGNEKRGLSNSLVNLKESDLLHMSDLIAYKLNEAASYDKSVGHLLGTDRRGKKEYNSLNALKNVKTTKWSQINLSDAFITESHNAAKGISAQDKGRILHFLLWAGLANIELLKESDDDILPDVGDIMSRLKHCTKTGELQQLFDEVSICLTTPLFYTRLGVDIVSRMGVNIGNLCKGDMLGKMLEVYVRGAVTIRSVNRIMSSVKLNYIDGSGEVDIYEKDAGLLLEVTHNDKDENEIYLQNYMKDAELVRVCSTNSSDTPKKCYHRISYAKLCCMIDMGDVFKLPRTTGYGILTAINAGEV